MKFILDYLKKEMPGPDPNLDPDPLLWIST